MRIPNVFSGDYLFGSPATPSLGFAILTGGFGLLLVLSILAFWRRAKLAPENPVLRRLIRRMAGAGMWISCLGLLLALLRYVQFDGLDMPIYMYLLLLGAIALVGYFVYDLSERYPIAVWRLEESHLQRRYRPAARPRTEPKRVRPAKLRGKQRAQRRN